MVVSLPTTLEEQSQSPYPETPFLWLWEIQVENNPAPTPSTVIRVVAAENEIALDGTRTFYPFPIAQGPIEESGEGDLPSMTLNVDNRARWLMPYLDQVGGLIGNRATAWLVNTAAVSEAQSLSFAFHIAAAEASAEAVNLRLEIPNPFLRGIPVDRYTPQRCRWSFGGPDCGYIVNAVAAYSTCDNGLADCILRGEDELARRIPVRHPRRFGGFRGVPMSRR